METMANLQVPTTQAPIPAIPTVKGASWHPERVVTVTFSQISEDDPGDCHNNFLKLYDGPDTSSLPVGSYCGMVCNPKRSTILTVMSQI